MKQNTIEPLKSPFSRAYLQQQTEVIINIAMGLKHPIDVEALKKAFSNSIMLKHHRFCSLMVVSPNGAHQWEPTSVSIDNHVIVHPNLSCTTTDSDGLEGCNSSIEAIVSAFLEDVSVSTPLSMEKPLWEVHVLEGVRCVVLRVHHAIGDGASMMAMLEGCFGGDHHENGVEVINNSSRVVVHAKKRSWKEKSVWGLVKSMWLTLVFWLELVGRSLWVKDEKCVFSGGDGVQLWPRKLITLNFKLEDFKFVKNFIPHATINDVLLGVISSGLSKYLQVKSPKDLLHGLQVTSIVVVNLRKNSVLQKMRENLGEISGPKTWGNKTGSIFQPIYCNDVAHPLEHVKIMKAIMDQRKLSYEAHMTYFSLKLITSLFGSKLGSWCTHRILCNTTMLISNIVGPSKELVIGDNPVTFLRVNVSSLPHALTIHMVSYEENLDVQVMVAKDIINDPNFLSSCFQESLIEMKKCISSSNTLK